MKYSPQFRIWHWLNAFVISGILITVFLRETFLNKKINAQILIDKLFDLDMEITHDQAIVIAKAIRANMWDWHIILGYALIGLIIYRIYLFYKDTSDREKFKELSLHKKVIHLLYYVIHSSLVGLVLSGLILYFYKDFGILKESVHPIKELHEFLFYIILYFIPLHIVGTIIAEHGDEKGIISSMVHGKSS